MRERKKRGENKKNCYILYGSLSGTTWTMVISRRKDPFSVFSKIIWRFCTNKRSALRGVIVRDWIFLLFLFLRTKCLENNRMLWSFAEFVYCWRKYELQWHLAHKIWGDIAQHILNVYRYMLKYMSIISKKYNLSYKYGSNKNM